MFKGLFGTVLWTAIQPTATIVNFVVSLFSTLTSIAWVPSVVTLVQLFRFIFYEPYFSRQAIFPLVGLLLKLVFGGVARSILALVAAFVAHPIAGVSISIGYSIKALVRYLYDLFVYGAILRPRARIPTQNKSFVARRIQGPGLSSGYFMQISPEDALLGLTVELERIELNHFETYLTDIINQPTNNLNNIISRGKYMSDSEVVLIDSLPTSKCSVCLDFNCRTSQKYKIVSTITPTGCVIIYKKCSLRDEASCRTSQRTPFA